jgi:large subunit ribosomal protein L21
MTEENQTQDDAVKSIDERAPWTGQSAAEKASKSKSAAAKENKKQQANNAAEVGHYAIVETGGHQVKVHSGARITVNRIKAEAGAELALDKVLMVREAGDAGKIQFGTPYVEGASVSARVVRHLRGEKIKVFKKKRRQGYKKLNGHRQELTELEIVGL